MTAREPKIMPPPKKRLCRVLSPTDSTQQLVDKRYCGAHRSEVRFGLLWCRRVALVRPISSFGEAELDNLSAPVRRTQFTLFSEVVRYVKTLLFFQGNASFCRIKSPIRHAEPSFFKRYLMALVRPGDSPSP